MKINSALVLEHRLRRSLSQDEFSIISGLSIRTIQRIEKDGMASLQSKKAIAAALEIDICDLDYEESTKMKKYEYKTFEMPTKFGIFKPRTPDVENLLNAEGAQGWRLHQIVLPASANFGQTDKMVVIFERQVEE